MRYFLLLTAPALLFGAPQPQHLPALSGPATSPAAPLAAPGAVLSNTTRQALLARTNLGRLWQPQPQAGPEDVLNGCFGYDGRRLEFVFTSVQADAKSSGRYLVVGKFRCYGDVTPFRGSIELQQVQRLPAEVKVYSENEESTAPTYCATGGFALQATSHHGLGGQFSGRIALDFQINRSQRAVLMENTTNPTTRNGGLLFDGAWREDAAGETVPTVWKQGLAVTRQVLSRFEVGSRDVEINPKYARVGWNNFWKNEEWWVGKQLAQR
ncbi:hypothetical protein [Hymenobacter terricola]|uniref:hypothetical protein n=1 Tax=Hymenobacter terricola TaxID=2819236 RepID=UPI001B30C687|nr:hypothetical protein [Hymenobacter terricola]